MKTTLHIRTLTVIVLLASLITGCGITASKQSQQASPPPGSFDQLVSRDFVSVLNQIDRLSPANTRLETSDISLQQNTFAEALKHELQIAGYAIDVKAAGSETLPVRYQSERLKDDGQSGGNQDSWIITVSVGEIAVRRTYIEKPDGRVMPLGAMQVRGADSQNLKLDNGIFSDQDDTQKIAPPRAPSSTIADSGQPLKSPQPQILPAVPDTAILIAAEPRIEPRIEPQIEPQIEPSAGADTALFIPAQAEQPLLDLVAPSVAITAEPPSLAGMLELSGGKTQNIRELQQSNFEALFADMGIVDEKVLTFPNDSIRMGDDNKARLNALLQGFNPQSDIFSLVGCSLGATAYAGGQEGLALGRAQRVREELLYAGIPENKILTEGCWAEDSFDERMPRRGVVVTLKRPIS